MSIFDKALDSCEANIAAYRRITPETAKFPYGDKARLFSNAMWFDAATLDMAQDDITIKRLKKRRTAINRESRYGLNRTIKLFAETVPDHFLKVMSALATGDMRMIGGVAFPKDRYGYPDIETYLTRPILFSDGDTDRQDAIASYMSLTMLDRESSYYDSPVQKVALWHELIPPDMVERKSNAIRTPNLAQVIKVPSSDGSTYGLRAWGSLSTWDMFVTLANLCRDGYEGQMREVLADDKQQVNLTQESIRSTTQIVPISKVAGQLAKSKIRAPKDKTTAALINVASKHERALGKSVYDIFYVTLDTTNAGADFKLDRDLGAFDLIVQSGLATAWLSNTQSDYRVFTAKNIAENCYEHPTKKQVEKFERYLDEHRFLRGHIDFSDEVRRTGTTKYSDDEYGNMFIDGPWFLANKEPIRLANGRIGSGYIMYGPPLLLNHILKVADLTGKSPQLTSTPISWYALGPSNTDTNLILKFWLGQHVQKLKNPGSNTNPRIRYRHDSKHPKRLGLLEIAEVNMSDRDRVKAAKDCVNEFLEALVKEQVIAGFEEWTEGHERAGIIIKIRPDS